MKITAFVLSWVCLGFGVVGLALGIAGNRDLATPGAILIGASIIALALYRR